MLKIFITATDTDAGKTYAAQALVNAFVVNNIKVAVYKPISAGCQYVNNELVNEDALLLLKQANCQQTVLQINPIAFEPAIAPHIAAIQLQQTINLTDIKQGYDDIIALEPEIIICEGAGGWRLPLGHGNYLSEFVQATQQNVILIVNMKLGCLNHAILTYQAIVADGLNCLGWIANCPESMPYLTENIAELTELLPVPKLAELAFEQDIKQAAKKINISLITEQFNLTSVTQVNLTNSYK
ncbi:dethiobiotin synthase [Colwellia sp. M166]|uniref:dethiobiotin synthase n=1 Tax=Colwellia sp. M166 TaxID=2583805 RepID=UPI00211F3FDF|nr:dethiobiotin synthase [Colwellia sp. M166]UUO22214.1 dethiobiotin synthase [Colwellia sp. M166]|tara:strand:- start:6990 stop:7712 length:723 start_codon:yes stop_codon:yes gene_type:complete